MLIMHPARAENPDCTDYSESDFINSVSQVSQARSGALSKEKAL